MGSDRRATWAFWIACGFAAIAALIPIVLAHGASSRVVGTAVPYGLSAVLMAANALYHHRGRPTSLGLYFLSCLMLIYAIFVMIALPVRLAVVGACPSPPRPCPPGVEPGMHDYEINAINASVVFGVLAIGAGFVGLFSVYRRKRPT